VNGKAERLTLNPRPGCSPTFNYAQVQREIAELDTPRARYQAQLDRWVGEQRAIAEEERRLKRSLDPYNLGLYDDDFHVLKKG
jgi:hypothetical protein